MEASALHAPSRFGRLPLASSWMRLRSDDQLVALFRAGSDEAFSILHDRYRQRLFAYVRQMLSGHSRQDAEDVLQDVFVRAFGALRRDERDVNVRAWFYRVAHNRCIDHLRRPQPPAEEIFEMSRKPLLDPVDVAQRRDDLKRLIADVGRLPEQQRSALLMREIDGLSHADLAAALDVSVPAVKSLLVRARVGLVEARASRDADCGEIQRDLLESYDRGVKASGRARRHVRECAGCREYRGALRGVRRSFAALTPAGAGPVALLAKLIGVGGAGGGAAAAGGGGGAVAAGGAATATACKVAAVVCATAITAGGAVEVRQLTKEPAAKRERAAPRAAAPAAPVAAVPAEAAALPPRPAAVRARAPHRTTGSVSPAADKPAKPRRRERPASAAPVARPVPAVPAGRDDPPVAVQSAPQVGSGGTAAPEEAAAAPPVQAAAEPPAAPAPATEGTVTAVAPQAELPAAGAVPAAAVPDAAPPAGAPAPPPEH